MTVGMPMNRSAHARAEARARRRHQSAVAAFRTRLVVAVVAIALLGGMAWYSGLDRTSAVDGSAVIERASAWTDEGVAYSQTAHKDGYRTDCSGFVSMAWNLPENLTTWRVPLVAREIRKKDLRAGDVLLDHTSDNKHVVIFEKWANLTRTKYWALELTGNPDYEKAVRRVVPYPYTKNQPHYKPYRFTSMEGYWREVDKSERQPVTGYKEEGGVE